MPDLIFTPRSQPAIDIILSTLDIKRLDVINKQLIGSVAINADELITNANVKILFLNQEFIFFNNEGANRTISFFNSAGGEIIRSSPATATGTNAIYPYYNPIVFLKHSYSVALANAATTLTFIGYRLILN
jgi:hypothetical protein